MEVFVVFSHQGTHPINSNCAHYTNHGIETPLVAWPPLSKFNCMGGSPSSRTQSLQSLRWLVILSPDLFINAVGQLIVCIYLPDHLSSLPYTQPFQTNIFKKRSYSCRVLNRILPRDNSVWSSLVECKSDLWCLSVSKFRCFFFFFSYFLFIITIKFYVLTFKYKVN